jgi:hypothetical protein
LCCVFFFRFGRVFRDHIRSRVVEKRVNQLFYESVYFAPSIGSRLVVGRSYSVALCFGANHLVASKFSLFPIKRCHPIDLWVSKDSRQIVPNANRIFALSFMLSIVKSQAGFIPTGLLRYRQAFAQRFILLVSEKRRPLGGIEILEQP